MKLAFKTVYKNVANCTVAQAWAHFFTHTDVNTDGPATCNSAAAALYTVC